MQVADILTMCFRELGWSRPTVEDSELKAKDILPACRPSPEVRMLFDRKGCWLARMLSQGMQTARKVNRAETDPGAESSDALTQLGRERLLGLLQAGWTLRDQWPRPTSVVVNEWLGRRLYFGRSQTLSESSRYSSIVSSQLGRHHQRLPQWPHLLDWALRTVQRDNSILLTVPGITLDAPTVHFAQASAIPCVRISLSRLAVGNQVQIATWLTEILRSLGTLPKIDVKSETIYISPAWELAQSTIDLNQFPLQDRAAIALADRVLAISIRSSGNIAGLMERRLRDNNFSSGTVFVAIENGHLDSDRQKAVSRTSVSKEMSWLDLGAVGWIVIHGPPKRLRELSRCNFENRFGLTGRTKKIGPAQAQVARLSSNSLTVVQLSAPVTCLFRGQQTDWPYLTHCTRGSTGPLPHETQSAYYDRLWQTGRQQPSEPLWTLVRILREQKLRGTTWMTRGNLPSVSLSAVPLPELLKRRRFQSHLGRWDWEPYGILIHKRFLSRARPVIYGSQIDFEQLPSEDRVYFQAVDSKYDWRQEREWRVSGDLDFRSLPSEAVTVFVHSQVEAVQLARESRFPVIWTEGIHS